MKQIFIKLNQEPAPDNGWTASIATALKPKNSEISIVIGESVIHRTKEQAWGTISRRAFGLDYINNEVKFNNTLVTSYAQVLVLVNAL